MNITVVNTLSGHKEILIPLHNKNIKLYVCGITPYDSAHIGHARVYIVFDVLYRLLTFLGYNVTYVRNFTDIDDKLLARAAQELGDQKCFQEIADRYIKSFHHDMQKLQCLAPTHEPRVTQSVQEIIHFIEGLIAQKKAYVAHGDVYYSIQAFHSYGKLSKQKLDDLRVGARVEVNSLKKDPLDFALWKRAQADEASWQSPWGPGRPGWHIECSVMAQNCLGDQIDIHGGGMDLIFPHHENEIAQSEGLTNKQFAQYWMHNAFVRINEEKMSKSLGNFFTIGKVLERYDPMILRYFIVMHHYRAPLDFSFEALDVAQKSYKKLCVLFDDHACAECSASVLAKNPIIEQMLAFLCDDLNTPGMFGVLFDNLASLKTDSKHLCQVKQFIQKVLGLSLHKLVEHTVQITPEIQDLLNLREQARAAKDWKKADQLRDQLIKLGVQIHDKKL